MSATTVRIRRDTRETLRELEHSTGEGPQELIARAVDQFRRSLILADTNVAYARAREAGDRFDDVAEWDAAAAADGLDD